MTRGAHERRFPTLHQRPWAVSAYLAFAALVGLAWGAPVAAVVGQVAGRYPRGDAEIFDPGGVMLVEAARRMIEQASTLGAAWAVVAAVSAPLGVVVFGFALAQLSRPGRARPAWAVARAVRTFPTLLAVAFVGLLASTLAVALVMMGGGAVARTVWRVAPGKEIARLGVLGAAILAVVAVGAVHDLARVAAVSGPSNAYRSLQAALRTLRRSAGRAAWAYAWRASLGVAALVAAAWLGVRLGHTGAGALVVTTFGHQLALALAGWLRLSWLAQAVRLVAAASPPAVGAVSAERAAAGADGAETAASAAGAEAQSAPPSIPPHDPLASAQPPS